MRRTATLFLLLCGLAALGFSKDVFLSIGGTVGNGGVGSFRTDLRIFNPSSTKDIQIQAYFLPTGGGDNSGAQPKTITVHPRQMAVYDDAITTLFSDTRLAGIRLSSASASQASTLRPRRRTVCCCRSKRTARTDRPGRSGRTSAS